LEKIYTAYEFEYEILEVWLILNIDMYLDLPNQKVP